MKTPVTKETIRHHFSYSLWKYALLVLLSVFGWSLIYSTTAYRAPEEKKVVMGVYSYGAVENITGYMETIRQDLMPDMEEMYPSYIMPDEMYGDMILTTRIAARECDIYVLPRDQFQSYAAQGAFKPLDEILPDVIAELEAAGISLSRGWRTNEELGEKHQYGIPCADLPGILYMLQTDPSDMYISIFFETGNDDNVIKFFAQFIRDMMKEPVIVPEG